MTSFLRRVAFVAVIASGVLVFSDAAHAQQGPGRGPRPIVVPPLSSYTVNPNWYVAPGVTLSQYAYNMQVLGQAYSQVPPWLYGYNPYPNPIVNYGPTYPTTPYTYPSPLTNVYSSYTNPYAYPGMYSNPFFNFYRSYP